MSNSTIKPSIFFWVISAVALIWNIMGVYSYLEQAYMSEDSLALLPEPEQLYFKNVAPWATAAFATAVFGGAFGSLALLIRKKWATILFSLSLIAVVIHAIYNFFIQEFIKTEINHILGSAVLFALAIFLVWYSKITAKKGWLS